MRAPQGHLVIPEKVEGGRATVLLAQARVRLGEPGGWLTPEEVAGLLEAYGVRTPRAEVGTTLEEVTAIAESIGYPVAMKIDSAELTHKSDVGGVKLWVRSASEVARAHAEMTSSLEGLGLLDKLDGILVQEMVVDGTEVIIGSTTDPAYGQLMMFGLGGVHVELMKDVSFRIPPLTDQSAQGMLEAVKGYELLNGYRGRPEADKEALLDLLHRISAMVTAHPEILEMDLNPVMVMNAGDGCVVVDARIRLGSV